MKYAALFAGLLAFIGQQGLAHADVRVCCGNKPVKWSSASQTFKICTPMQGTWADQPFRDAAARWSGLPGSTFSYSVINDDDGSISPSGDGNEVGFFNTMPAGTPSSALAVTISTYTLCETCDSWTCGGSSCSAGVLQETDIYFRNGVLDTSAPANYVDDNGANFGTAYFANVASHELGHALGLLENTSTGLSRMESHVPSGGWFNSSVSAASRSTPMGVDVFEVAGLYPSSSAGSSDLYASNMQHQPTSAPDSNGNSIPLSWAGDGTNSPINFPKNRTWRGTDWRTAKVGDIVDVRVCFGNKGPNWTTSAPLTFRFSADSTTAGTDTNTPDGWFYPTVNANSSWCETLGITVPSVTTNQLYYVLFGINGMSANNWQVINRRIRVIP